MLDDVRYPCNGIDAHPFCASGASPTYNGVIDARQLTWLRNDLAHVPEDKLLVLNAHIPFVSYTDATQRKHQIDNLAKLYAIVGDRPALGLSGHTHTTEQIMPGEHFAGWQEATATGPAPFHQIVTGAVSGSWWAGDLDNRGIPHATQRLGAPRGYYELAFDGHNYVDTYRTFGEPPDAQMHASSNTPRFRHWAETLFTFVEHHGAPSAATPPVTVSDLGDMNMLTLNDLNEGTWVAINVWNGSRDSTVSISIDGEAAIEAQRSQSGTGEAAHIGPNYADPFAIARQATQGRLTFRSSEGGDATAGFTNLAGPPLERRCGAISCLDADPEVQPPVVGGPAGVTAGRRPHVGGRDRRSLRANLHPLAVVRGRGNAPGAGVAEGQRYVRLTNRPPRVTAAPTIRRYAPDAC